MAVVINGTTGITNPNGSAGAPVFTGQGSNTGLYFPSNTSAGIATAGLGRVIVDANGYTTMPYQPAFDVSYSGSAITSGVVLFNNIRVNVGSNYSSSTGRFTAPVAGLYQFGCIFLNSTGSSLEILFNVNGTISRRVYSAVTSYNNLSGSFFLNLSANDYVNCEVGTGSMFGSDVTYVTFCGRLIQ